MMAPFLDFGWAMAGLPPATGKSSRKLIKSPVETISVIFSLGLKLWPPGAKM